MTQTVTLSTKKGESFRDQLVYTAREDKQPINDEEQLTSVLESDNTVVFIEHFDPEQRSGNRHEIRSGQIRSYSLMNYENLHDYYSGMGE